METKQRVIKLNRPVAFSSGDAVTELACKELTTIELIDNGMPFEFDAEGRTEFPIKRMITYLSLMTGIPAEMFPARLKVLEIVDLGRQIAPLLESDLGGDIEFTGDTTNEKKE